MGEDVLAGIGGVGGVDTSGDGANHPGAVEGEEPFDGIVADHGNSLVGLDAEGDQGLAEPRGRGEVRSSYSLAFS